MLSANDASALCRLLEQHRIQFWVIGGWGVDALLHRETRPHKDLDILVAFSDLPMLWEVLDEHSFTLQYVWKENRWVDEEDKRWPTAFVMADGQGRELDIHVIDFGPDGAIIQLYNNPWSFPDAITGQGSIADTAVTCVSKQTQLLMHTGYSLPEGQLEDVKLLQADGDIYADDWTERLIALLLRIAAAAEEHGRRYYIGGGLAVDLAFGGLSRSHEDIDFHPLEADTAWWKDWFKAEGYIIGHDPDMQPFPFAFLVTNERQDYLADVYPMRAAADDAVEITHTADYDGRPWWAGKSWRGLRRITYRGQVIVVERTETVLAQKAGHVQWHGGTLDEKHLHDFRRAGMTLDDMMLNYKPE